jgi:hypothetical protein
MESIILRNVDFISQRVQIFMDTAVEHQIYKSVIAEFFRIQLCIGNAFVCYSEELSSRNKALIAKKSGSQAVFPQISCGLRGLIRRSKGLFFLSDYNLEGEKILN